MNWKKGDIAICIDNYSRNDGVNIMPPLKINAEYIVNEIIVCACGFVSFDVGIISRSSGLFQKCNCGAAILSLESHLVGAFRFIKKDPRSIEERISEAVEKEEYELAHELTQLQRSI